MTKAISDVINSEMYSYEKNTINLLLFANAESYIKSGNKSIWAIFSEIVELPPILRHAAENTIFHSSWSDSNPDFNINVTMFSFILFPYLGSLLPF